MGRLANGSLVVMQGRTQEFWKVSLSTCFIARPWGGSARVAQADRTARDTQGSFCQRGPDQLDIPTTGVKRFVECLKRISLQIGLPLSPWSSKMASFGSRVASVGSGIRAGSYDEPLRGGVEPVLQRQVRRHASDQSINMLSEVRRAE